MDKEKSYFGVAWQEQSMSGVGNAVYNLVRQINDNHTEHPAKVDATPKQEKALKLIFRHSEQARGQALHFMQAFAEHIGVKNFDNVRIAKMKDPQRALQKMVAGRSVDDVGRGCILISDVEQYEKAKRLLTQRRDEEGHISDLKTKSVRVIPGRIHDYIKNPTSKGFSGSINVTLETDFSKGRSGTLEMQIRPELYEDANKHSHPLYALIRVLDEIPKHFRTREQTAVKVALIRANRSLFDEEAERHGWMDVREDKNRLPSEKVLLRTNDILDRIAQTIQQLPGKSQPWRQETKEAIAYAKTSMLNLYAAGRMKQAKMSPSSKPALETD